MSPEVEKELKEKYPKTFSKLPYFECGDGWKFIIKSVAGVIEREIEGCSDEDLAGCFSACQVKEKFGQLRFYVYGYNETIDGAIRVAERMSAHVCETCGNVGQIRDLPCIRTLCDKHFEEELKRRGL